MKEQIYQSGFYLLIGIILGFSISFLFKDKPESKPQPIKIELYQQKDSIKQKTSSKQVSEQLPKLNDKNLKKELIKQGIKHPQIVLAQAKLESGNYTSNVYKKTNNLFGLRKGNRYRRFGHWTESIKAYKNLIQSKYNGGNYLVFLSNMGYAADAEYINKLKQFI